MSTTLHVPALVCPVDACEEATWLGQTYNNGSAQFTEWRCQRCRTIWTTGRSGQFVKIIERGTTMDEQRAAMVSFAALQAEQIVLRQHNAPQHWMRGLH